MSFEEVAERAFRSCKTVDLQLRPVYYRFPDRDRSQVFLSMLAFYAEWRIRGRPSPILFDEPDRQSAARRSRWLTEKFVDMVFRMMHPVSFCT